MDAALLKRLFGTQAAWQGPCVVVLDAAAAVQTAGADAVAQGGQKIFAPRLVSGRLPADAVCLLADHSALLVVMQQKVRSQTGEESIKQSLIVADITHVVAVEFPDTTALAGLGLTPPAPRMGFTSPIS
jgi:hypothetical protein